MIEFTKYCKISGKILSTGIMQVSLLDLHIADEPYVVGNYNWDTHYINLDTHQPILRNECPYSINKTIFTADGVDAITITALPVPCLVSIDDATYTVTDSIFEFSTGLKGKYKIILEHFPFLTTEIEVTAV